MPHESVEYIHEHFRYPDKIAASVPRDFRDRVKRASEAQGTSSAQFIRQAIERKVEEVLTKAEGTQR